MDQPGRLFGAGYLYYARMDDWPVDGDGEPGWVSLGLVVGCPRCRTARTFVPRVRWRTRVARRLRRLRRGLGIGGGR